MNGKIYMVGAGPGDPKLITIKGLECIKQADIVIYDRLAGDGLLKYAPKGAELIYAGKDSNHHTLSQDRINQLLVEKALEEKIVVRLKGGDPFLFGRGGEEAEFLFENNIEFEIVPGVTSAVAVPTYAGIPVTHRDYCSSVHIVTGHQREADLSHLDYSTLSGLEGTLVFLMGVKNIGQISCNLISFGKDPDTPVAVIENGTTANQRVVTGKLKDIAGMVLKIGINPPAVIVIGKVVQLQEKLAWFKRGVLAGKRIVVTRPEEQALSFIERLKKLGADVLAFPTIKIQEPDDFKPLDQALDRLDSFQWIVFTSTNGVKIFFNRMKERNIDIRQLAGIKLCAIGEMTAKELSERGLNVDFIPMVFTTEFLLQGLLQIVRPGERVLLARADIANSKLPEGLKSNKIEYDDVAVYKTAANSLEKTEIIKMMEEDQIDFITFTSPSTVKGFISIVGSENIKKDPKTKAVCIGPVTAQTAEEAGFKVADHPENYTVDGLIEKLIEL